MALLLTNGKNRLVINAYQTNLIIIDHTILEHMHPLPKLCVVLDHMDLLLPSSNFNANIYVPVLDKHSKPFVFMHYLHTS